MTGLVGSTRRGEKGSSNHLVVDYPSIFDLPVAGLRMAVDSIPPLRRIPPLLLSPVHSVHAPCQDGLFSGPAARRA